MIRWKLILTMGIGLVLLLVLSLFLFSSWKKQKSAYNRIKDANISINKQLSYFQNENGQLIAQNQVLNLRSNELSALLPQIAKEIKNLQVQLSRAQSVSTTIFTVKTPATVHIRDSTVYDTVAVRRFDYNDGFFTIQGTAIGDQQQLHMSYQDTLVQVVFRGKRKHPWLWIFSKRILTQRVSFKNPNARIHYTQHIEIEN